MADFTTLLNKGHRAYIDLYVKKRKFGDCEGCEKRDLLVEFVEDSNSDFIFRLCPNCYRKALLELVK